MPSFRGATLTRHLDKNLAKVLREKSAREGVTGFMWLLAAFKAVLHRYTHQQDIVVGSPIAGRTQVETEQLIGLFVNTLALRTQLNGEISFRELLNAVRETTLGAYANQEL